MLRTNSQEGIMFIRIKDIKSMTVCAKKLFKKTFLQVIEYKDGDTIVVQNVNWVKLDLFGTLYMEKNNIKLYAELTEGQEIARVAICTHFWTGRRLVEVIELTDGTILVNPLSKGIIKEKVDASILEAQLKCFFEGV